MQFGKICCMQVHSKSPIGDGILQVVVDSWAVLGRAVLAAEEAAMVLLVLAPALQALALVLLGHSDCIDELDVGIPVSMHSCSSAPVMPSACSLCLSHCLSHD